MRHGPRVCGLMLAFASSALLRADPEADVRTAFDRLTDAGNYAWTMSHQPLVDSTKLQMRRPYAEATGETSIDGFTTIVASRRRMILRGDETAVQLKSGWRLAADLAADEAWEVVWNPATLTEGVVEQPPRAKAAEAQALERARHTTHALPHEVLRLLLPQARNFRPDGAVIAADLVIDAEQERRLRSYLLNGVLPRKLPRIAQPSMNRVSLFVGLQRGQIEEVSVEFSHSYVASVHGAPGSTQGQMIETYTMTLSQIGTTKVEVEPEVKALFTEGAGR